MTLQENQFTLRVDEAHSNSHSTATENSLEQEEGTRGLYTYFGCLPRLLSLSPLPPTALPQRVISSVSLLSHLISQPSVISVRFAPSLKENSLPREYQWKMHICPPSHFLLPALLTVFVHTISTRPWNIFPSLDPSTNQLR